MIWRSEERHPVAVTTETETMTDIILVNAAPADDVIEADQGALLERATVETIETIWMITSVVAPAIVDREIDTVVNAALVRTITRDEATDTDLGPDLDPETIRQDVVVDPERIPETVVDIRFLFIIKSVCACQGR